MRSTFCSILSLLFVAGCSYSVDISTERLETRNFNPVPLFSRPAFFCFFSCAIIKNKKGIEELEY